MRWCVLDAIALAVEVSKERGVLGDRGSVEGIIDAHGATVEVQTGALQH